MTRRESYYAMLGRTLADWRDQDDDYEASVWYWIAAVIGGLAFAAAVVGR